MNLLTSLAIGILFAAGIYQILRRNLIRAAIGLVLISNAVNLFLFSAGAYTGIEAAYSTATRQVSDPLPQALVLTAIVISMGGFAFVLSLLYVISTRYKTSDSDEVKGLKN
ncbi:MAG: NADH-quinone oxidoreductase subunit K [Chloroflexi bacterium]|jgi:multicomponent Na+:H+ antiporter subunit C|nr:NADH-quinone oxidoreductase subunit K [Chloroflexota bacterium]